MLSKFFISSSYGKSPMEGLHEPENKIMSFIMSYCFSVKKAKCDSLREKCPYSELFSSRFSRIRNEYEEIRSISPR